MFNAQGELWMRNSIKFETYFFGEKESPGASIEMEIQPSDYTIPCISSWPCSVTYINIEGRGYVTALNDGTVVPFGKGLKIAANARHTFRNELRTPWKIVCVLDGSTGAEKFLDTLKVSDDEEVWVQQSAAYQVGLFLPKPQMDRGAAMVRAENKIHIPLGSSFGW